MQTPIKASYTSPDKNYTPSNQDSSVLENSVINESELFAKVDNLGDLIKAAQFKQNEEIKK